VKGGVNLRAREYAPHQGTVHGKMMTVREFVKVLGVQVVGVGGTMMPGVVLVAREAR
jgi:hypothetical protein